MEKHFSDKQVINILRETKAEVPARELCHKHVISNAVLYIWRKKYSSVKVSEVGHLKSLEEGSIRLKKLPAEAMLDKEALRVALG